MCVWGFLHIKWPIIISYTDNNSNTAHGNMIKTGWLPKEKVAVFYLERAQSVNTPFSLTNGHAYTFAK